MAKKKPTIKNIRQGQTIYRVSPIIGVYEAYEVRAYFLYSHKTELPPRGQIIDRLPVSLVREYISKYGNNNLFYTREKAEHRMQNLLWAQSQNQNRVMQKNFLLTYLY